MSFKETLNEALERFVPWTANGNGWKVWTRESGEDRYRCIAVVVSNATAHRLKDGLKDSKLTVEITRGCTTGIYRMHRSR